MLHHAIAGNDNRRSCLPRQFACAQCHTTPSYQVFTCLTCHGKADMDSKHRNRNGYRYDSLTCYGCHPTGRAG